MVYDYNKEPKGVTEIEVVRTWVQPPRHHELNAAPWPLLWLTKRASWQIYPYEELKKEDVACLRVVVRWWNTGRVIQ